MKSRNHSRVAQCILVCLSLFFLTAAKPVKVVVDEAIPNSAEQDTVGLIVRIKGNGFASGASVAFWRTGTTNPGGVSVTAVNVISATDIDATIDVALSADIDDYDIQVQVSSGRKGRGTTLFSVKQKGGGSNDTTPPSLINDFRVGSPTFSTSATLRWTAPGDDGDSGSIDHYMLRQAAQADPSACDGPGPYNFTFAEIIPPPSTSPAGWIYALPVEGLTPETCYAFEIEPFDDAGNTPGPSYTAAKTVAAPIQGAWSLELISPPAYEMRLRFDPRNNQPVILGGVNSSNRIYFYERSDDDGSWTPSEILKGGTMVSLAFNPSSNSFGAVVSKRGQPHYAEQQSDGSWNITRIVRESAGFTNQAIVFDSAGNAVIVYSIGKVIYIARQNGSSFDIETPSIPNGIHMLLQIDPDTMQPVLIYVSDDRQAIISAEYDGSEWSTESIVLGTSSDTDDHNVLAFEYDPMGEPVIIFQQEQGTNWEYWAKMMRQDASGNWDVSTIVNIDPNGLFNQNIRDMVITSDGTMYVSATNTTNQAKIGKFCEAGRGFTCTPTMDASGMENVWLWEVAAEGVGQHGRSVAVDELTGAIALITNGSEGNNPDDMHYYECDPTSASVICGSGN